MVFSSLTFLFVFLPVTLVLYFLVRSKFLKNIVILIASLIFYAWGEPVYVSIMLISICNDYGFSLLVSKSKELGNKHKALVYISLSVTINLGLLLFFKYYGFALETINSLFNTTYVSHDLPLPIGISFYTFQTMSYSLDVYFEKVKAQRNFLTLATYVAMFPQLIAGPIVRYITVENELTNREESFSKFAEGLRRFIIGLGKKVIIANQMGYIADTIFNRGAEIPLAPVIWIGTVAYAFQIYYDFSGYSDMAIGIGRILGFHFLENFNYPYCAKSITDFWRRWHISLSTWFRDYVYIPLGGNKRFQYRNIFVVWMLTGLWHGASWNYVLWGLYYCCLLILEKTFLLNYLTKIPDWLQRVYALVLVSIGWMIFRIEDMNQLAGYLGRVYVLESIPLNTLLFELQDILYAFPYFIPAILGSMPIMAWVNKKMESKKMIEFEFVYDTSLVIILCVSIIFLLGEKFNPFIYYRF